MSTECDWMCNCSECGIRRFCHGFMRGEETRLMSIVHRFGNIFPVEELTVTPLNIRSSITGVYEAVFRSSTNHGRVLAVLGMVYRINQSNLPNWWYEPWMAIDPLVDILVVNHFSVDDFRRSFRPFWMSCEIL